MDPLELPSHIPDADRDAWRCDYCQTLIYNTDELGRPKEGAPWPKILFGTYKKVCNVCFALHGNGRFGTDYWQRLHREWQLEQDKKKNDIDKQTGRRDYFTGA